LRCGQRRQATLAPIQQPQLAAPVHVDREGDPAPVVRQRGGLDIPAEVRTEPLHLASGEVQPHELAKLALPVAEQPQRRARGIEAHGPLARLGLALARQHAAQPGSGQLHQPDLGRFGRAPPLQCELPPVGRSGGHAPAAARQGCQPGRRTRLHRIDEPQHGAHVVARARLGRAIQRHRRGDEAIALGQPELELPAVLGVGERHLGLPRPIVAIQAKGLVAALRALQHEKAPFARLPGGQCDGLLPARQAPCVGLRCGQLEDLRDAGIGRTPGHEQFAAHRVPAREGGSLVAVAGSRRAGQSARHRWHPEGMQPRRQRQGARLGHRSRRSACPRRGCSRALGMCLQQHRQAQHRSQQPGALAGPVEIAGGAPARPLTSLRARHQTGFRESVLTAWHGT
jgi:hypothetical protein